MPVTVVKEDPRRGRGQNNGRSNGARPERRAPVYAGGPADYKNHRISPNNPWTAYKLPHNWQPKLMENPATRNSDSRAAHYNPTRLSDEDQARAVSRLESKFSRRIAPSSESAGSDVRRAVVIDTESTQSKLPGQLKGVNPLASLGAVDFQTGETLLDIAVLPEVPITQFMPRLNGINARWYHDRRRDGSIVQNAAEARRLLARYVSKHTVVIGHALINECKALGMGFARAYDTQDYCESGCKGLRYAAPVPCQDGAHSAVEDALSTRELALMQLGVVHRVIPDDQMPPPPPLFSSSDTELEPDASEPDVSELDVSEPRTPPSEWQAVARRSKRRGGWHEIEFEDPATHNLDW